MPCRERRLCFHTFRPTLSALLPLPNPAFSSSVLGCFGGFYSNSGASVINTHQPTRFLISRIAFGGRGAWTLVVG